ncbi:MAG: MYXO-CTERM sorting domain-containing protein [Polyangiaceae bacterium]
MNRKHLTALSLILAAGAYSHRADAVEQPQALPSGLELASGIAPRVQALQLSQVPNRMAGPYRAFRHDFPGSWVASWDQATQVPHRLFGDGIEAPGSVADPTKAAQVAEAVLTRHLALLAPGAQLSDFVLAENVLSRGMRVVSFLQYAGGRRVLGGQLSFRFKNDRLFVIASKALPHVGQSRATVEIDAGLAAKSATQWIEQDFGPATIVMGEGASAVEGPFVLPVLTDGQVVGYHDVLVVTLDVQSPRARFDVYVDVTSGAVVAREQTLHFATGQVLYNAPVRYPQSDRQDYPAAGAQLTVSGSPTSVSDTGQITFGGATASVTTSLSSPLVSIDNQLGPEVSTTLNVADGGMAIWDESQDSDADAQLSAFIHAKLIKDYVAVIAPEMNWVNNQLEVNVNINDQCNAFYDGTSINFYRESNQCNNTARLADVVYHEFGHGVHHHAVILGSGDFEEGLSEGVSDYLAATYTSDSGMGRGFTKSNAPLRQIDPPNGEAHWPEDISQDPHETGLIIAGALWDLRKLLVAKYGETQGVVVADDLYYQGIRNADDIPSMYTEVLAADDDDGNLANGTPNVCEIIDAFGAHGLRTVNATTTGLSVEPPTMNGHDVSIELEGLFPECPSDAVTQAEIMWRPEDAPTSQAVDMAGGPTIYTGTIPDQPEGTVVRYRVELSLAASAKLVFPANPADQMYQFFIGEVTPIYCTDFETDPEAEGWTHQLLAGQPSEGADDWQWGQPNGTPQNGDPPVAFSGISVFGNDLGAGNFNGLYQGDKTNAADSPVIDVSGHDAIRLQYRRWLNVEDGVYDRATIYANGAPVWSNFASQQMQGAGTHHTDREWRFHDVDLTDHVSDAGTVQIRFEIASDQGLEFGGWNLDDFCVVAYDGPGPQPQPVCGNGQLEVGESCDDGNTVPGDGCDELCQSEGSGGGDPGLDPDPTEEDPFTVSSGCGCRVTGTPTPRGLPYALLALGLAGVAIRRRRRD